MLLCPRICITWRMSLVSRYSIMAFQYLKVCKVILGVVPLGFVGYSFLACSEILLTPLSCVPPKTSLDLSARALFLISVEFAAKSALQSLKYSTLRSTT
jgi:hypothetical protein